MYSFPTMIFYDFKSGLNQQQSHSRLQAAFGNKAPSWTTVYDWFADFEGGSALWKMTPSQDAQLKQQQVSKWLQFRDLSRKMEE